MFVRLRSISVIASLIVLGGIFAYGQETPETPAQPAQPDEAKAEAVLNTTKSGKDPTAEQVAETSIMIYGNGGGRLLLNQIRKTSTERGKISSLNAEGKMDNANYQRWMFRTEDPVAEKVRLETTFPTAKYSLILNGEKVFGIFNGSVFTPLDTASNAFKNRTVHGLEALLRYKENGSTLALAGRDKHMGVEYFLLDLTDKMSRVTRFYISVKTFRVMMLDYEDSGTKYRRKFYDYNLAQGTLVPYRTVLYAGDKVVEEMNVGTVTFGQKVDDGLFAEN